LLTKHKKWECDVVSFVENYSECLFDVNHIDNRMRSPLHSCAVMGHIGVLKGLLNNKLTNPNLLDKDNCTPLCLAIREEKFEVAKILI
jgi:ankyrin repeat protein